MSSGMKSPPGMRTVIFSLNALVFAAGFIALLFVCLASLKSTAEDQTEQNLQSFARALASVIPADEKGAAEFINAAAESARERQDGEGALRITLIRQGGSVAADTAEDARTMPNHADRPEVRAALSGHEASSVHESSVTSGRLMYFALPVEGKSFSVLRLSMKVSDTVFFTTGTTVRFTALALALLVLALAASFAAAESAVRPLRETERAASEYAKGDLSRRVPVQGPREASDLARAFNAMAETCARNIERLEKSESVRRDFVANVSHELKTPVTSVKGFTETLIEGAIDDRESARHFLGIINTQCDRIISIIEDLLTLSRLEDDAAPPDMERCDFAAAVRRAYERCLPAAREKNIALSMSAPPSPIIVRGAAGLLESAATNLIDNSIRYCPEGSRVTCTPSLEGGAAKLIVEDTGPGIPPELRERIFERFFRVDKSRSRETGGTGLGLSIVRHIAAVHGGEVRETGREDGDAGARFVFTLPRGEGGE